MSQDPHCTRPPIPALLRHRMLGNAALYTLGTVAQRGAVLLVLPLYTVYLPPSEFGVWTVLATLVVLVTSVADLGVRNATIRLFYEHADDGDRIRSFLLSGFVARAVVAAATFALLLGVGGPLWARLFGTAVPFLPFAPLVGAVVVAELMVSYALAVLRVQERAGRYVMLIFGQTVVQIAASLFFIIVLGQGALGPLNGLLLGAGAAACVASALFIAEHGRGSVRLRISHVRESLAYGLPLVPHHVGGWLRNSADRFVLLQYVPLATVGVYHLGYSAGLVMALLAKGVNMAYEPYYYRLKKTHPAPDRIIRSVAGLVGAGLGGVCLVGVLFTHEVFEVLLAPDYREAARVAPLILTANLMHGVNTQLKKPLLFYRKTAWIPWLTVAPGIATFALCFVLIPIWGMMAAVWLTVANHLLVSLGVGAANRRLSPGQYPLASLALCQSIVVVGAVWVTYPDAAWMPTAEPLGKVVFLAVYAVVAWLLLVRVPLATLRGALPQTAVATIAGAEATR